MTGRARGPAVRVERREGVVYLTLARPERLNALVPELVDALGEALARTAGEDPVAVVLAGEGRAFSSGGDVAAFRDAAGRSAAEAVEHAHRVVGGLHACMMHLLESRAPVIARVQGFATGGASGLLFVSDMVVMAEDAFLQPYYGEIGFAPDGGWTALLPDLIGPARAIAWQATNRRVTAAEAVSLGLASMAVPAAGLDGAVAGAIEVIRRRSAGSLGAARALVWDRTRRAAVRERLDAEERAFAARIALSETKTGMERFLGALHQGGTR